MFFKLLSPFYKYFFVLPILYLYLDIQSIKNDFIDLKNDFKSIKSFFKSIFLYKNDRIILFFFKFFSFFFLKKKKLTNLKKNKIILSPSLNVYYPIKSSIFSITIRITGVLSALISGFIIYF